MSNPFLKCTVLGGKAPKVDIAIRIYLKIIIRVLSNKKEVKKRKR